MADGFKHIQDWIRMVDQDSYNLGLSFLAICLTGIFLWAGVHHALLRRTKWSAENRRRWANTIRNLLVGALIVGLGLSWASQLENFAVSMLAIAVALAIGLKELIDCLSGNIYRLFTGVFSVGDRIEVDGVRGNVVDVNPFSTTILEIGPGQTSHQYTGRAMTVPNSVLLRQTVTNESYSKEYRVHIITIPLKATDNWQLAERILLDIAKKECRPFIEKAKQHLKKLEGKTWLDAPSVEPRVTYQLPEPDRINLLLRIPCPTRIPSRLEQAILRQFLFQFHAVGSLEYRTGTGQEISPKDPILEPAQSDFLVDSDGFGAKGFDCYNAPSSG